MSRYVTMGPAVREWITRNVRQTKGRWAGKPIEWDPFQIAYLDELYLIDTRTMLRVYTTGLLGLPKKNGKSTQAAGEALHGLCADVNLQDGRVEPSPEVYLGAKSRDQAGAVFRQAEQFVKDSPRLSKRLRTYKNTITNPENPGSFLKAMSGESGTAHGINVSRGVIDELHEFSDDKLLNVFEQSGEARLQPLLSIITHAGYDEDGVLGERYRKFMEHPELENPNPGLWIVRDREVGELFWWYGADAKTDDPSDPKTWMMTNPASWITEERMGKAYAKTKLENFCRFRLNMWVNVESSFLPTGLWASLRDDDACQFEKGEKVWAGVDIALRHDNSAVVLCAPTADGKRMKFKAMVFEHEEGRRSMKQRAMAALRQVRQDYRLMDVAYDQAYFQDEAHELEDEGMPMVQYGQGTTMTKATQHFLQDAIDRKLCHDGDRALSSHLANAVVRETEAGNRITKRSKSSKKKIDVAVAAIMAREICAVSQGAPEMGAFWA